MFRAKEYVYMFHATSVIPWLTTKVFLSQEKLYPALFFVESKHPSSAVLLFDIGMEEYHTVFIDDMTRDEADMERTWTRYQRENRKKIRKLFTRKRLVFSNTASYFCHGDWYSFPKEMITTYFDFLGRTLPPASFPSVSSHLEAPRTIEEMLLSEKYLPLMCRYTIVGDEEYYTFHNEHVKGGISSNSLSFSTNTTVDYDTWDAVILYTALLKE